MSNKRKIDTAVKSLGKFYDLPGTSLENQSLDILGRNNAGASVNQLGDSLNTRDDTQFSIFEKKLNDIMYSTADGAPTTFTIIKRINEILLDESASTQDKDLVHDLIQIYYASHPVLNGTGTKDEDPKPRPTINNILKYGDEQKGLLNANASNPTKDDPSLSIILSNSMRMSLENKNIDPATIILNGLPNVELARASPYVSVQFFTPRAPTNEKGQIQALSLLKFLEGGKNTLSKTEEVMLEASHVKASDLLERVEDIEDYTMAGMELFTSPQTLTNGDTPQDYDETSSANKYDSVRANPVLDKFRPFMSLNDIELKVVPTKGAMSFKSGTMRITLHDRSRLSEIAEFIRADMYKTNEILIEYGWSHPDGNVIANQQNPYNAFGLLLDGTRVKEKYNIINSSFSFKDSGEVEISLSIVMRGATASRTEFISSNPENSGQTLKELEQLQESIAKLRDKIFGQLGDGSKTKEIRGSQILEAATDVNSFLALGSDLKTSLRKLRYDLRAATKGKSDLAGLATQLLKDLDAMFDAEGSSKTDKKTGKKTRAKGKSGAISQVRNSILKSISDKITKLNETSDPWLADGLSATNIVAGKGSSAKGRYINKKSWTGKIKRQNKRLLGEENPNNILRSKEVSLAYLLLHFVGEPIANSRQYDDVQMIFYPFNVNAGAANQINVANFLVDLPYFVSEFARYRLERVSKSGNMSVEQFLHFVQETLLDDPAAKSYGLHDTEGAFYKAVVNDGEVQTRANDNVPKFNERMHTAMKKYTHDGVWKQPQIRFYIESLAEQVPQEDGVDTDGNNSKTILRIHIFDQQATSYTTVQSILNASRDSEIEQIKSINLNPKPNDKGGNAGVQKAKDQVISHAINLASSEGFLEKVGEDPQNVYVIRGGSKQLKRFIQSTVPYIIYGAAGSTVSHASLTSMQNPALNTVQIQRNFKKSDLVPNGENPGGLPMRIIPTQLDMTMLGNPFIDFAQYYFIDFQTGTTADNLYIVTGITHKLAQGSFTTDVKFAPGDGFGKYQNLLGKISEALTVVKNADDVSKV